MIALRIRPNRADTDAGVIHKNVDASESIDATGNRVIAGTLMGHIPGNREYTIGSASFIDFCRTPYPGFLVDVEDHHVETILRQGLRHNPAQAPGAAGDESSL
jgi:hypothetical protein